MLLFDTKRKNSDLFHYTAGILCHGKEHVHDDYLSLVSGSYHKQKKPSGAQSEADKNMAAKLLKNQDHFLQELKYSSMAEPQ